MKKFTYLLTYLLTCLSLFVMPLTLSAKTLTIYHTSDTHGFFYPEQGRGGFAALASLVESGPKNYLLLDSGDFANGTPEAKFSNGLKPVAMFNKMGYHATTIGDHEFDFKEAGFEKIMAGLKVPVLAANFVFKDTHEYPSYVKPYKIYDVDGIRIAVIGLANATPTKPVTHYEFLDPLESIARVLPEVEAQHPSVVVVIVHDSIDDDVHGVKNYTLDIAHRFPGRVHLVLGGHAHKLIANHTENGTLYVESGYALKDVGVVTVEIDDQTGKVKDMQSNPMPLSISAVGEDKIIRDFADSMMEECRNQKLGYMPQTLVKNVRSNVNYNSPISYWLAELMRQAAGTPIAINNNGGMRKDLENRELTECDIIELYPFDDDLVIVEVPGKFLREFVSSTWGMFSYAGVGVGRYQDEGDQRVRININGIALDDTQVYQVAVPEFIANGNMEARLFAQISADKKKKVNGVRIRELMRKDLRTPKESFAYDMYNYPTIVDDDELANMIKKSYHQRGNSRL